MDILNRNDLVELIEERSVPCVSLYTPTQRSGKQRDQNLIRFKNQLREAEERLIRHGMRGPQAKEWLRQAEGLRTDSTFWVKQSDGLVVFCAGDFFRYYRLPVPFDPWVHVGQRFSIKPVLPMLQEDGRFYILALSQNSVRLFQATRHHISEMELAGIPRSMAEAVGVREAEGDLHFHVSHPTMGGRGRTEKPIYHGTGSGDDYTKRDMLQFFQRIDQGLRDVLRGETAPMILACVGYLAPIYEEANTYPHLVEGKVPGHPDSWTSDELRDRGWHIVEPYFRREQDTALANFRQIANSDRASTDLRQIVLAADEGSVDTLFLARGTRQWGTFDREQRAVILLDNNEDPQGEDLLDFAAAKTLVRGGKVYLLESQSVPGRSAPCAALLRYPIIS